MKHLIDYIYEAAGEINAFVILKPEFLQHQDDWEAMIKNNGWQFIEKRKLRLTLEQASELYKQLEDKPFYNDMCKYMSESDCICATCYKECKDPIKEMRDLKHKVRKEWEESEMKNAMHSSDSMDNVKRESDICLHNIIK